MINLDDVIVVSLPFDLDRRRYIETHFESIGIQSYRYFEAIQQSSPLVRTAYKTGRVLAYPGCFRCGRDECDCPNNILIPAQVANWLSFQAVWKSLPPDPDRYFLLCEDDVAFHKSALNLLDDILDGFVRRKEQVLIRLSASGQEPFRDLSDSDLRTTENVVMSNAAYILNGALAARLSREAFHITHTSDVWLHKHMASDPKIQALTIDPLLATDLSYNKDFARFVSRIHPKGIDSVDEQRKARHVMRVNSLAEYRALLATFFDQ